MMPGGYFGHLNGTLALMDLALGYIVCYLASQVKGGLLKKAGYLIGVSIVIISGLLVIGKTLSIAKLCCNKSCPMMSSMNMPDAAPCSGMSAPKK
jgi:hypothetical protein